MIIEPIFENGGDTPTHYRIGMPELVLLNSVEVGFIFGITPDAVKEWRRSGVLCYVRIKGHVFYRLTDLLKTLDTHTFRNDKLLPR